VVIGDSLPQRHRGGPHRRRALRADADRSSSELHIEETPLHLRPTAVARDADELATILDRFAAA